MVYKFETESEPVRKMKVKIEANTREHFVLHGLRGVPHRVDNPWFTGEAGVPTYELDELLGTKLRALYQRKKGRDLFDLHEAGRREVSLQCKSRARRRRGEEPTNGEVAPPGAAASDDTPIRVTPRGDRRPAWDLDRRAWGAAVA